MPSNKKRFQRPLGKRRYKKLFLIAVEGTKTEPQYFTLFDNSSSIYKVKCIKGNRHSAPPSVLKRMKTQIREESLKSMDEAWLIVDKDSWTDDHLSQLHEWSTKQENYHFALSNPNFEYWLLLHFDDAEGVRSAETCFKRLKKHIPDYDKGIDKRKFSQKAFKDAIKRAKQRDNPPCTDWPRKTGSTVYRLIERILQANK